MALTEKIGSGIDTTYILDSMTKSFEAKKNLCLLAVNRRMNLEIVGSSIYKTMQNYSAAGKLPIRNGFNNIVYIDAMAREMGSSLLGILYMGPKERGNLLHQILKSISSEQVLDYVELGSPQTGTVVFGVQISADNTSPNASSFGYRLIFRKRAVMGGDEHRYTLDVKRETTVDSDINNINKGIYEPYPFFVDVINVWEESDGILARYIDGIIASNPVSKPASKKQTAFVRQDVGAAEQGAITTEHTENEGQREYEDVLSQLKNSLSIAPDNEKPTIASDLRAKIEEQSKNNTKKEQEEDTIIKEKSMENFETKKAPVEEKPIVPEKRSYRLVPCSENISKYLNEQTEKKTLKVTSKAGRTHMIPVVFDKVEMKIYIDLEYYKKYKTLLKRNVEKRS